MFRAQMNLPLSPLHLFTRHVIIKGTLKHSGCVSRLLKTLSMHTHYSQITERERITVNTLLVLWRSLRGKLWKTTKPTPSQVLLCTRLSGNRDSEWLNHLFQAGFADWEIQSWVTNVLGEAKDFNFVNVSPQSEKRIKQKKKRWK